MAFAHTAIVILSGVLCREGSMQRIAGGRLHRSVAAKCAAQDDRAIK